MTQTFFCCQQKPQYQPQLQMLQMVGPNDNDYIYINFKDFEYDSKWEFPRENLELGMNAINTWHTPDFFSCFLVIVPNNVQMELHMVPARSIYI